MCWAHARRKIVEKISVHVVQELQEEFEEDIDKLQVSSSQDVFNETKEMFKKKWKQKKQTKMLEYLNEQYFTSHDTWYEGVALFKPSQNNACEANNKTIKDEHTVRERLTMGLFKLSMMNMVRIWSEDYDHEKMFIEMPTITLRTWTKAYNWNKLKKSIKSVVIEGYTRYYVPAGSRIALTDAEIDTVVLKRWNTFDQYKKRAFSVWIIDIPLDTSKWFNGICNCPHFLKTYTCQHVVGIALRLKYCKAPPEAKNVPLGQKRKPGRPSKAKKALLVQ